MGILSHLPPTTYHPYMGETGVQSGEIHERGNAAMGDAHRVLYGSDWPLESIETAVRLIEGLDLPTEDQDRILGENARELFRIDAPG